MKAGKMKPMLDSPIEYAPDLEWLLQSDQAPPEVIVEGLVHEFYPIIYHLANSILDSRAAARRLSAEIIVRAYHERHSYRQQIGVRNWLFRIALDRCIQENNRLRARRTLGAFTRLLEPKEGPGDSLPQTEDDAEIWLALDGLEDEVRILVLLAHLHAWKPAELAALLDRPQAEIQAVLDQAGSRILHDLPEAQTAEAEGQLRLSLQRRRPFRRFSPEQLDELTRRIGRSARRSGDRRRTILSLLEVGMVLLVILLAAGLLFGADRLAPEPTPTPQPILGGFVTRVVVEVTATRQALTAPQPSPPLPGEIPAEDVYVVKDGDTWETIARELEVGVDDLLQVNRAVAEWAPSVQQRLLNPRYYPAIAPVEEAAPAPALGPAMSLEQALTIDPPYETLWLDALAMDYGPESYIGPPRANRIQVWRSREVTLALAGEIWNLFPEDVWLRRGMDSHYAQTHLEQPWVWPWLSNEPAQSFPLNQAFNLLSALVERGDLSPIEDLSVLGKEHGAWGFDALVVDHFDAGGRRLSRLWLDERTGLVLQRIFYSGDDLATHEYRILNLTYDTPLPTDLVTAEKPWRGGYARNAQGEPEIPSVGSAWLLPRRTRLNSKERRNPPLGFEPAAARLIFQYPEDYSDGLTSGVELFADGYYLTTMAFGNPWTTICERSPGGSRIAFVSQPSPSANRAEHSLHVFDLYAPTLKSFTMGSRTGVSDFAFSPDGARLAFFEHMPEGQGSLAVWDFEGNTITRLLNAWDARSLVWSPDGLSLAMIAHMDESRQQEHILVANTQAGSRVIFRSAIDIQSHRDQRDWPMLEWGVEFPVERGSLDTCAQPPDR